MVNFWHCLGNRCWPNFAKVIQIYFEGKYVFFSFSIIILFSKVTEQYELCLNEIGMNHLFWFLWGFWATITFSGVNLGLIRGRNKPSVRSYLVKFSFCCHWNISRILRSLQHKNKKPYEKKEDLLCPRNCLKLTLLKVIVKELCLKPLLWLIFGVI